MAIRMIGGKGKGRQNAISLAVEEMRDRCDAAEADAAIEAFLRGDEMTDLNRRRVVDALVRAETKLRASRLVAPQECESGGEVSS